MNAEIVMCDFCAEWHAESYVKNCRIKKRDDFAVAALTGLLAHEHSGKESAQKLSEWAFECADAMLAARKEGK